MIPPQSVSRLSRWQGVLLGLVAAIATTSAALLAVMFWAGLGERFGTGPWLAADVLLVVSLHAVLLALPLAARGAVRGWRIGRLGALAGAVVGALPLGAALLAIFRIRVWSDIILLAEIVAATGAAGALGGWAYAAVWRRVR